jgi:glycosyltransferase involved in cell wall biosynthesis
LFESEHLNFSNQPSKETTQENIHSEKVYNTPMRTRGKTIFSVIIPCYNLGPLLIKAVQSIEKQTLGDIEIIVVDDVSTDHETKKILKSMDSADGISVIYRNTNGGASAARNTGIKSAKSEFILCLDADDSIAETYLEKAYAIFIKDVKASIGIVAPYTKMTGERTGEWKPKKENATIPVALIASPIPNASCFRKAAWKTVGGYDENLRGFEDWELWISILESGYTIDILPEVMYFYYNRPGSKVKTSNKNASKIMSYIVEKHKDTYTKHMTYVIAETHKRFVETRTRLQIAERSLAQKTLQKFKRIVSS